VHEYDSDSNDENHYANDYPDEEGSSDSAADSEDSDLLTNMRCSNDYFVGDGEGEVGGFSTVYDKYVLSDTDSD